MCVHTVTLCIHLVKYLTVRGQTELGYCLLFQSLSVVALLDRLKHTTLSFPV